MAQFRKSKKLGPFRVTASKNGLGFSAGAGPVRVSRGADGKTRRTISAPGTGIYDTKVVGGGKKSATRSSQSAMRIIQGVGGYIEFDGETIIVRHDPSRGVADIMFPLGVVETVRFLDAERKVNGHLQFVVQGESNDAPEVDRKTLTFTTAQAQGVYALVQELGS